MAGSNPEGGPRNPQEAFDVLSQFPNIRRSPMPAGLLDIITHAHIEWDMLHLGRAAEYEDGRPQSNAEHSWFLAQLCKQVAASQRPDLNRYKIIDMCDVHDKKEVYSDDTPIHDESMLASKEEREQAGLLIYIMRDLEGNQYTRDIVEEYEKGESPEAKFVYAMDKFEPVIFALKTRATTQRKRNDDFIELVTKQLPKTLVDPTVFNLMVHGLRELGKHWEEWGCKPFEGDPDEIVQRVIDDIRTS